MRRIKTDSNNEAVIACCDRPVVFYELDESIEMHYLAYKHIREISCLTAASAISPTPTTVSAQPPTQLFLLYEDNRGVLHISQNDNLQRLQV